MAELSNSPSPSRSSGSAPARHVEQDELAGAKLALDRETADRGDAGARRLDLLSDPQIDTSDQYGARRAAGQSPQLLPGDCPAA